MRDGLLGLDQPARDGGAHAVERHFLEVDALVERLDLRGADAPVAIAARAARPALAMADSTSAATMRPCGPEPRQRDEIDAVLAGQPPRQAA